MNHFLPVNRMDMQERGWDELDFCMVSADAYVDHPSFGHAIIARVLEHNGYKVGIIPQPDWHKKDDFMALGKPKLGFLVCGGNMDSMVNHYTVAKKRRTQDAYSPNGELGHRPDRASIVYSNKIRECYGNIPIILGGIEASLRRFAHYDYWDDAVRRSILDDSGADLLVYGMGERQIVEIAEALASGIKVSDITFVPGTCYMTNSLDNVYDYEMVHGFSDVKGDKKKYAKAFAKEFLNQDMSVGKRLVQAHANRYLVQNPPAAPLSTQELDEVYALPYQRTFHPMYENIPAIEEVKFSLVSSRGCFGGCAFCALSFHQGRVVQKRSVESITREAEQMIKQPDFKGNIHDVGGPTANFRQAACAKQRSGSACMDRRCLSPKPCPALEVDHKDYLQLLRRLRRLPGVKNVFIRSGLRYDYIMLDREEEFFYELVKYHISGQLKIAPEHISDRVLAKMGKPSRSVFEQFVGKYREINKKLGKNQFIVPYLMSSHPGSEMKDAIELAEFLHKNNMRVEQVQDFYPTPGTISTCMYYTGYDPLTMEAVYVPKDPKEKQAQRVLLQYYRPENRDEVEKVLIKAKRTDLIGFGEKCLIHPKKEGRGQNKAAAVPQRERSFGKAADRKGRRLKQQKQNNRING